MSAGIATSIGAPPEPAAVHEDILQVGSVTGPFQTIATAAREDEQTECAPGPRELREVETSRYATAYLESFQSCVNGRAMVRDRILLVRPGDGQAAQVLARTRPVAPGLEGDNLYALRLTGRYVAWTADYEKSSRAAACVYDLRANSTDFCVRAPSRHLEDILEWVAVQADGKLVLGTGALHELVWLSARKRPPRRIGPTFVNGIQQPASFDVAIAHDSIAFNRQVDDRTADLAVTDLHGNAISVFTPARNERIGGIDFDGRRLAWAVYRRASEIGTVHLRSVRRPE